MTDIADLADLIRRHAPGDGMHQVALPRVMLVQASAPSQPVPAVYQPSFCLVAQGRKQASLGATPYVYDAANFLVVGLDLLVSGSVVEASPDRPYLCLCLTLDVAQLSDLLLSHPVAALRKPVSNPAIGLGRATPELIDAAVRLARLLDAPEDAPALARLAEQEILYRLMISNQAEMIRHIAMPESRLSRIARAIAFLKENYARTASIGALAEISGMSPSAFHEHFRTATGMSPLQYRNRLRLQEARRLMVIEGADAAAAGFRVGYDSPSQFSRDYARAFGAPPARDAARIRMKPELALGA
jgi:AraC-like DNA-binding protein